MSLFYSSSDEQDQDPSLARQHSTYSATTHDEDTFDLLTSEDLDNDDLFYTEDDDPFASTETPPNGAESPTTMHNVVLDMGSGVLKAGFAGEEYPSTCFPTLTGSDKIFTEDDWRRRRTNSTEHQDSFALGQEALDRMMELQLEYPIERGAVKLQPQFEALLEHLFLQKLDVDPESCNVLLAQPPMRTRSTNQIIAELFFELFAVNGMLPMEQSVLSLSSTGRTTGLVLDSGDQLTHVVPIVDNYMLEHAVRRLSLGGRDVTLYLQQLMMRERGIDFTSSSASHQLAREIKENLCFVSEEAPSYHNPQHFSRLHDELSAPERSYELPDGTDVTLAQERCAAAELLFQPMLCGMEADGISQVAYASYKASPLDVREVLRKNVQLVGGNTLFEGFEGRMQNDMGKLNGSFSKSFKVNGDKTRQFSAWMGGSVVASLSTFSQQLVSRQEYEEEGPRVLLRRA